MDNIIVRWYNQNRKTIWVVILTIVAVIGLVDSLDKYYENNQQNQISSTNSTTDYDTTKYSIITQDKINDSVSNESVDLIEEFLEYCNNQEIENAYNLLSTECIEELFPTIEDFKKNYYNKIFTEKKSFEWTLWISNSKRNTYRIKIIPDLLATGEKSYMSIEEYYTITTENGRYRLNINNFIGIQDINSSKTENGVTISVVCKKIYMEYEIYEIKIENNTGTKLLFNTKENTDSIYIQDQNEVEYIAFLNEIPDNELEIADGHSKSLEIKFNRGYKPTIHINKIVFNDIRNKNQVETMEVEL